MDDLISRAAALNAIDCWHIDFNSMDGAKVQTDCWRTIKELPAVDAAPVVRCSECKYRYFASNRVPAEQSHACIMLGLDVQPDFYCAYGESRGGEP